MPGWKSVEGLFQDLRYATRQLGRNPGFAIVAVLSLALGIGANTAIFGLIDHVMLRLLPVRNPEELLVVRGLFSYPRFEQIRDRNEVFSGVFGSHTLTDMTVKTPGNPTGQATGELVSGTYFQLLGVNTVIGRPILPEDDRAPESSPVAVISYGFWKQTFGGSPDVQKAPGPHGFRKREHRRAGYLRRPGIEEHRRRSAYDHRRGASLGFLGSRGGL